MKGTRLLVVLALCLVPAHLSAQNLLEYVLMNSPIAVAVNPVTNMVYAANVNDGTVSVMDGSTNEVVATISVGPSPGFLAVNPVTNLIYVSNAGTPQGTGMSIMVIDGSSNSVIGTLPLVTYPGFIAVNPTTNMVYFTDQYASIFVTVLNGATNQVVAQVLVKEGGCCLYGMALNSVANRLYLSIDTFGAGGSYIAVMDTSKDQMAGKFTPPGLKFAQAVAVDSGLNRIYESDNVYEELFVIDGRDDSVIATLPHYASSIAINETTHVFAVADLELTFIDGLTDEVVGDQLPYPACYCRFNLGAGVGNRFYVGYDNYLNNNAMGALGVYSGPPSD